MKLTREQVEAMRESFDATNMTDNPMDQVCAELLAAWDCEAKLREAMKAIQARAASTRGEQAYRELPSFVINATSKALRDTP